MFCKQFYLKGYNVKNDTGAVLILFKSVEVYQKHKKCIKGIKFAWLFNNG